MRITRCQGRARYIGVLMDTETVATSDGPHELREASGICRELLLVVARLYVSDVRTNPYLEEHERLSLGRIIFGMRDARTGRHDLYFSCAYSADIPHTVLVRKRTAGNYGDYFHILVLMRTEALLGLDTVVVYHEECPEAKPLRVVPVSEAEAVPRSKPSVVAFSAVFCMMDDGLHIG